MVYGPLVYGLFILGLWSMVLWSMVLWSMVDVYKRQVLLWAPPVPMRRFFAHWKKLTVIPVRIPAQLQVAARRFVRKGVKLKIPIGLDFLPMAEIDVYKRQIGKRSGRGLEEV